MIRFQCPACGKNLAAPEEKAGARSVCRGCNQPVIVPHVFEVVVHESDERDGYPVDPSAVQPKGGTPHRPFSAAFVATLREIYDTDIAKDPDELVSTLADILRARRSAVGACRQRFVAALRDVSRHERVIDADEYVDGLCSALLYWRSRTQDRLKEHLLP